MDIRKSGLFTLLMLVLVVPVLSHDSVNVSTDETIEGHWGGLTAEQTLAADSVERL